MKTTSKFLLLLACFFASYSLSAQINYGVKGGFSLAKQYHFITDVPDEIELDWPTAANREGFHSGIWANMIHTEKLTTQVELLFSEKGFISPRDVENPLIKETNIRLRYISMPIMEQYHFGNFAVELGIVPNYILQSDAKSSDENDWRTWDIGHNEFELGLLTGLSYQINRLTVGLRYDYSLTAFDKYNFTDGNGADLGSIKFNNSVIQISAAVQINSPNKS